MPYDQLTSQIGPLSEADPRELGVVLIESPAKAARRPYHKQKLAYVLANQRQFALEQAARGVAVRYEVADVGYRESLAVLGLQLGPMTMMEAAERELRVEIAPLVASGALSVVPHAGFLTNRRDFETAVGPTPPWRMDAFYRHVRGVTGILMDRGKPLGGKYSFDAENRRPWRGEPTPPTPPKFAADEVTREVGALVADHYASHPGELDLSTLPATLADAEATWQWALGQCLPHFGPFEDAMSTRSTSLFHTRISPLLNLHRLIPARVIEDVARREQLPLASREGFIRQILGWREFVRHVHVATDGFRGVTPPDLGATLPLPPAYWGAASGLACLDQVVSAVWREGYSHHITRLMVLSNLATLLAIDPRELTDWFWVAYVDAYDWVVEPNVLGMGTFALGELFTTKPYISGAAYIDKMSDYCGACAFDPKKSCPITRLYWSFLARHTERFAKNPRLAGPIASVRRRSLADRAEDARVFDLLRETLARGEVVRPAARPAS